MTTMTATPERIRLNLRWVRLVLGGSLTLVALAVVAILMIIPQATGGAALTILSGSMTPTYPVGSVVVVQPVPPEAIEVGDVITYATADSLTTHRVAEIGESEEGTLTFTTKGDANRGADKEPVAAEAVRGRVLFHVPHLGRLRDVVSSPLGLGAIAVLVTVIAGWDRLASHLRRFKEPDASTEARWDPPDSAPDLADDEDPAVVPGVGATALLPSSTSWPAEVQQQQLLVAWLAAGAPSRGQIVETLDLMRGHVVAFGPDHMVVTVTGTPAHLDGAERLLHGLGLVAAQRSAPVRPPSGLLQRPRDTAIPDPAVMPVGAWAATNGHKSRR